RMGDFARMLQVTAEVSQANVQPLLQHLSSTQKKIAIEGSPVVTALYEVLSFRDGVYLDKEHPAKEWYKLCANVADSKGPFLDAVPKVNTFGRQLTNSATMLAQLGYVMHKRDTSKGTTYRFTAAGSGTGNWAV